MVLITANLAGYLGGVKYIQVTISDVYMSLGIRDRIQIRNCTAEEAAEPGVLVRNDNGNVDVAFCAVVADSAATGVWMSGYNGRHESEDPAVYSRDRASIIVECVRDHFASVLPTPELAIGKLRDCDDYAVNVGDGDGLYKTTNR